MIKIIAPLLVKIQTNGIQFEYQITPATIVDNKITQYIPNFYCRILEYNEESEKCILQINDSDINKIPHDWEVVE